MTTPRFDPSTLTNAANESFTVRRVFGEAYERAGTLVIPVARVWGATGSGSGGGEMAVPHHGDEGAQEKARPRVTAEAADTRRTSRRSACSSWTTPARTGSRRST